MKLLTAILAISVASAYAQKHSQRKPGDPLKDLPPNIEVLTHFGERADISPDNQRVAFMAKSFGDAMLVDLKTRAITCLTCNVPGASFLRVMHLITGDYILIGPERFEDIHTSRSRDNELWFLSKERGSKPVKLRQKMSRGRSDFKEVAEGRVFRIAGAKSGVGAGNFAADDRGVGSLRRHSETG